MRRRTVMRDVMGTVLFFLALLVFTALLIWGENLLEAFKSH
jgi:hypothetical protein